MARNEDILSPIPSIQKLWTSRALGLTAGRINTKQNIFQYVHFLPLLPTIVLFVHIVESFFISYFLSETSAVLTRRSPPARISLKEWGSFSGTTWPPHPFPLPPPPVLLPLLQVRRNRINKYSINYLTSRCTIMRLIIFFQCSIFRYVQYSYNYKKSFFV